MSRFSNSLQHSLSGSGMILLILMSAMTAESQSFLSLNDAISLGLKNNFSIRMARNDSVMAGREVTFGNAGMLPSLQAYASLDKSSLNAKTHTILGSSIERKSAAVNLVSTGLQLRWTLFDGTGMFVEYDKLKSHARLTNLELRDKVERTVFDITAAYFDIARQKQLLRACEKRLETSDLRLSVARSKYRSGLGSEQEMLQADVIRLADTTALANQQTFMETAALELNKIMGIGLAQRFACEDTIALIALPPIDQLKTMAMKANSAYLQAGEMQNLGTLDLKLLRSKQLPAVTLRGAYGLTENKTEASLINYSRTFGPSVGVTASIGIFDGLNLTRKITQARTELENRGIRLKELEQELEAEILDAWYIHQNLLQAVELGQRGLGLAKKNMAIASEAFSAGMASSLQLREAQEDLFLADANLLEALYQARMIEIALLKIAGELIKTGDPGK